MFFIKEDILTVCIYMVDDVLLGSSVKMIYSLCAYMPDKVLLGSSLKKIYSLCAYIW